MILRGYLQQILRFLGSEFQSSATLFIEISQAGQPVVIPGDPFIRPSNRKKLWNARARARCRYFYQLAKTQLNAVMLMPKSYAIQGREELR